ncbi:hypothetical protein L249_2323 [Ophiocordyceps polyrhachis-furcata BCC 54312]|uniref:ZP domain-containing protein n=1 Tax=Ophiocordyceps polyrhachis-furcata BCC 54312 TaxID=1330021 RepID=A0A367LRK3_9HYPO|nr:hypothetical protein L249_2323 [Ophiocordyceps polyrhachis-furcata BCC 54312]
MKGLVVLGLHALLARSYQYHSQGPDLFQNYLTNVSVLGHSFSEPKLIEEWHDNDCDKAITNYVMPYGLADSLCKTVIHSGKVDVDGILRGQASDTAYHVRDGCDLNRAGRVCRVLQARGVVGEMHETGSFCYSSLRRELHRQPGKVWELCRDHIVNNVVTQVNHSEPKPRTEMVFSDCFHSQFELARACEMLEPPKVLASEHCASTFGYYHVVFLFGNALDRFCRNDRPELKIPYRIEKALEKKTSRQAQRAIKDSCHCHNLHGHERRQHGQGHPHGDDGNVSGSHPDRPTWPASNVAGINRRQDWNDANRNQPSWSNRNRPAGSYGRDGWQDTNRPRSYDPQQQQPSWSNRGNMPGVFPASRDWNGPNRNGFHNQQPWSGPGMHGMRTPWSGPGMTPHGYGATPYVPQGPVLTEADVEKLLQLSKMFKFEIRSGLFAIQDMPQPARDAGVSWRLVYDLDVDVKAQPRLRFELCDAREQGRVVTKIRDQYVYGYPLEVNGQALATASISATGQNELLCDNGDLTYVKIKNKSVPDFRPADEAVAARRRGQFIKCDDINKCQESRCEGDSCSFNLVASVTVEAKTGDSTSAATATATARASFKFDFEPCQTPKTCNCVRTCAENNNCMVQRPIQGLAPAPVPREQVRGATVADLAHVIAAAKAGHDDRGAYAAAEAEAGFERGRDVAGMRGSRGAGFGPGFDGPRFPGDGRAGAAPISGHVEVQGEVMVGGKPSSNMYDSRYPTHNSTADRFGRMGNKGLGQQPGWNPSDDRSRTVDNFDNADGSVVFAGCGHVAVALNILIGAVGLAVLL